VTVAWLLGIAVPIVADADHSHHHEAAVTEAPGSALAASFGLLAASFTTASFVGDYQGLTPGVHWTHGRYSAASSITAYQLRKNGALYRGVGDLFVQGQAVLLGHHARSAGLVLAMSAPTGSQRDGFGMGHVMVMPGLWGSWSAGDTTLAASAGYGHAIGASQSGDHPHGTGPIVDPMNMKELTWSVTGELAVARELRIGARLGGALSLEQTGVHRTIGAARAVWSAGRVDTSAEVQVGLSGDPFNVRGVVETALRF